MDQSHPDSGSVVAHYETLLADVYDWMQGGWEAKTDAARKAFAELSISPSRPGARAVDLGAGTGYQSIPLAELGFAVLAVDSSAAMLKQLDQHASTLPAASIQTVVDDVRHFDAHLDEPAELIVCMGDTLAHLDARSSVRALIETMHRNQPVGGRLVLGFRDSSQPLTGDGRFIPVRSDHQRVFTCFIEEADGERLLVHDVLHTRNDDGFTQQVSSYHKIRLSPGWVAEQVSAAGYSTPTVRSTPFMTELSAIKER